MLICGDSDHATRPQQSIPIKLGSRLDGTSGMVPRWATCQLMSTALLCVLGSSWAVSMETCATGTSKKPRSNNTTILKYCRTSAFRVASLLWCHGWFRSGIWPPVAQGWDPISKPSMAIHGLPKKASMLKFLLPKCPVLPHCQMENGSSRCLLKRWFGQRIALAMKATARSPDRRVAGTMRHKIDALFRMEARNLATTQTTQGRRRRTLTRRDAIKFGSISRGVK